MKGIAKFRFNGGKLDFVNRTTPVNGNVLPAQLGKNWSDFAKLRETIDLTATIELWRERQCSGKQTHL